MEERQNYQIMAKNKPTSIAAYEYIKPHKPSHKQKILEALAVLKVGANHEMIAQVAGLRPDQVWKRLSECQKDGTIFDTGINRPLKSGLMGTVWQLSNLPIVNPENPTTDKQVKQLKNAGIKPHFQSTQANLF